MDIPNTSNNQSKISLLEYLQQAHLPIPLQFSPDSIQVSDNVKNRHYSFADIADIREWPEFNIDTILQEYGDILSRTLVRPDPYPNSPPQPLVDRGATISRLWEYLGSRVRRSLRAGFEHLRSADGVKEEEFIEIWWDSGDMARVEGQSQPDLAFFEGDSALAVNERPNRCPGVVKSSTRWQYEFQTGDVVQVTEFKQILSQINFYMRHNDAQYGYILTDREMVVIKRQDRNWRNATVFVSRPISWVASGTAEKPQLTVLLALWYFGMKASKDSWRFPSDAAPQPEPAARRSRR